MSEQIAWDTLDNLHCVGNKKHSGNYCLRSFLDWLNPYLRDNIDFHSNDRRRIISSESKCFVNLLSHGTYEF